MQHRTPSARKEATKFIALAAKVLISFGAVAYLATRVEPETLVRTVSGASLGFILSAVLVYALQPLLGAIRWWELLRAMLVQVGFGRLLQIIYVSLFFNQILPASVGGDVIRVWLARRDGISFSKTVISVFIDRFVMVLSLLVLVALGYVALARSFKLADAAFVVEGSIVLFVAMLALILLIGFKMDLVRLISVRLWRFVEMPVGHLRMFLVHPRALLSVSLFCLASHINIILTVFLLMLAFDRTSSFLVVAGLTPLVLVVATLPISFGGWGVRELAMVTAFAQLGVPEAAALSASVLLGILGIVITLPGAAIFATLKREARPSAAMPERLQELELS